MATTPNKVVLCWIKSEFTQLSARRRILQVREGRYSEERNKSRGGNKCCRNILTSIDTKRGTFIEAKTLLNFKIPFSSY